MDTRSVLKLTKKRENDNNDENDKFPDMLQLLMKQTEQDLGLGKEMKHLRKGFFPRTIGDNVLVMSSRKMETTKMRTFIFGAISGIYDEEMWNNDVKTFGERFTLNVEDIHTVHKIKMCPADSEGNVLDTTNAISEIYKAVEVMNAVEVGQPIRIAHLGFADSKFFFQGVEYLLENWRSDGENNKTVYFVTTGDTDNKTYENFCKSLVLRKFCTEIEFYNCQDYFPFGKYSCSNK